MATMFFPVAAVLAIIIGFINSTLACQLNSTITNTTACNEALEVANCADKGFTEVPLENIPCSAIEVDLSRNDIMVLQNNSFHGMINITWMSLSNNIISDIHPHAFTGLENLIYLDLSRNSIQSWPHFASACSSLQTLKLYKNKLGKGHNKPTCLTSLRTLDISHNWFSTFPDFTEIGETIAELHLNFNYMTSISDQEVEALKSIEYLSFFNNSLKDFSFLHAMNSTLQSCHMSGNPLEKVDLSLLQYAKGSNMDFDYCSLTHIPKLGPFCGNITHITFAVNFIHTIDEHAFQDCSELQKLDIAANLLTQLPNLSDIGDTLQLLDFDNNKISFIPETGFQGVKIAVDIDISYNDLVSFPRLSESENTLKYVDLRHNNISEIQPEYLNELVSLEVLKLDNNALISFPDVSGPGRSLRKLFLSWNALPSFPSLANIGRSLTELDLSGNQKISSLSQQDISPLINLLKLYLNDISIEVIPAMDDLPVNLMMDASSNPIKSVSPRIMAHLVNSQLTLDLQNSLLRTVPTSCGDFSGVLDFRGSPVDLCSCEMAWLKLIQSAQILVDSIMCSGSQWQDLSYRELYEMCTTLTYKVKGNWAELIQNIHKMLHIGQLSLYPVPILQFGLVISLNR